jgi:hypothetical protein
MSAEALLLLALIALYLALAIAFGWPHFLKHPWWQEDCARCLARKKLVIERASASAIDEFNADLRKIGERRLRR